MESWESTAGDDITSSIRPPPLLWPKSSSIISEANLSSSVVFMQLIFSVDAVASSAQSSSCASAGGRGEILQQLMVPNSTFLCNQFASSANCLPVCFCMIPSWLDCWGAPRHRHVSDCCILVSLICLASISWCRSCSTSCAWCSCCWDAKYQRWSFALRVAESIDWDLGLLVFCAEAACFGGSCNGKLVRAWLPHISRAASS